MLGGERSHAHRHAVWWCGQMLKLIYNYLILVHPIKILYREMIRLIMDPKVDLPDDMDKVHLPDDMVAEIFLHLPLSSLHRLRYVSKHWLRRICDDPTLSLSHLSLHPPIFTFLAYDNLRDRPVDLLASHQPRLTPHHNIFVSPDSSGAGLALVTRCHIDHAIALGRLWVWDPATRLLSSVPPPPGPYPLPGFPKPRGIALISGSGSFKVILVAQPEGKAVLTYSSILGRWTATVARSSLQPPVFSSHTVNRRFFCIYASRSAVVVGGSGFLFWPIRLAGTLQVLAYDVQRRSFSAIQLPAAKKRPPISWCLDQWEGRLRYTAQLPTLDMLVVWDLSPPPPSSSSSSWRLVHKCTLTSIGAPVAMYGNLLFLQREAAGVKGRDLPALEAGVDDDGKGLDLLASVELLSYHLVKGDAKEISRSEFYDKHRRIVPCINLLSEQSLFAFSLP